MGQKGKTVPTKLKYLNSKKSGKTKIRRVPNIKRIYNLNFGVSSKDFTVGCRTVHYIFWQKRDLSDQIVEKQKKFKKYKLNLNILAEFVIIAVSTTRMNFYQIILIICCSFNLFFIVPEIHILSLIVQRFKDCFIFWALEVTQIVCDGMKIDH